MEPTPGEPWEPVAGERGSRWWLWLLLVLVLAAAGAGAAYLLLAANRVVVPSVTHHTFAKAASTLHSRGLEVAPVNVVSSAADENRVISQSPSAGAKVKKGTTVTLKVGAGPGRARVPDVGGMTRSEAERALRAAGFNYKDRTAYSDTVPKGQAIGTTPPAGEQHTKGSSVTLTVSRGPQGVVVPKLTGLQGDAAQARLKALGLTSNVVEKESMTTPGKVLAQDVPPSSTVNKGTTVTLTVAKPRPTVPDVTTGNPLLADAQKKLEAAGYKVDVRDDPSAPPNLAGRVTRQSPAAGQRRSSGATVVIHVGTGGGGTQAPGATPTASPTATATP
jgi:serine/threonine-protein kinase